MYTKSWLVIKDDSGKTFEVCGKESNDNAFTNNTYAMQKAGMNVSSMTLPVTNKYANRETISIVGYVKEEGLHQRLLKQFREITMRSEDHW